jgi:Putative sensor
VETVAAASVWQVIAGRPGRFLLSLWPWRSLAYLCSTVIVAGRVWLAAVPAVLFPPLWLLYGLPVGAAERVRLGLVDGAPARSPHLPRPRGPGRWLRRRLREPSTWRELGYTVTLCTVLMVADLAVLGALLVCALLVCRSRSRSRCPAGCPPRSSRPGTSWSPRRSPTAWSSGSRRGRP